MISSSSIEHKRRNIAESSVCSWIFKLRSSRWVYRLITRCYWCF